LTNYKFEKFIYCLIEKSKNNKVTLIQKHISINDTKRVRYVWQFDIGNDVIQYDPWTHEIHYSSLDLDLKQLESYVLPSVPVNKNTSCFSWTLNSLLVSLIQFSDREQENKKLHLSLTDNNMVFLTIPTGHYTGSLSFDPYERKVFGLSEEWRSLLEMLDECSEENTVEWNLTAT